MFVDASVIVGILALAMGMQNAAVLFHPVPDVATNVMTLTLVRLLSNWSLVGEDNARWHFRVGSLTIFFVSAAVGAARSGPRPGPRGCPHTHSPSSPPRQRELSLTSTSTSAAW